MAHFPGGGGCEPVGRACPSGDWPSDLPSSGVVYVRSGAGGGDGSRDRPFGTVRQALARAVAGNTIAMGPGVYREAVTVTESITLRGVCAARTSLAPGFQMVYGVVNVQAADVGLQDLTIGPAPIVGAVWVEGAGRSANLDGVVIEQMDVVGIRVQGRAAQVRGRSVVIRETQLSAAIGYGYGLLVDEAANVDLSRVIIEDNHTIGVSLIGAGTTVRLEDAVVRGTRPAMDGTAGVGLSAANGASAELARVLVERNRTSGVLTIGSGSTVTAEDTVVVDTLSQQSDQSGGTAFYAEGGASIIATRVRMEGNLDTGMTVVSSSLQLTDALIGRTETRDVDEGFGRGLSIESAAIAELTRVSLVENQEIGLYVEGESMVRIEDLAIRDNPGREDGQAGRGIFIGDTADVQGARLIIDGNREGGVLTDGAVTVRLEDVLIARTASRQVDRLGGRGFSVQGQANVELVRALIEENREVGIGILEDNTTVQLRDVVVRDTASQDAGGFFGRGIGIEGGAVVNGTRVLLERNREVGLFAGGTGAVVSFEDLTVLDTLSAECAETCGAGAMGVGSYADASLTLTSFVIRRSDLCGAQVALAGRLELNDGAVTDNDVGACVQVDGYPLSLLSNGVLYESNGADVEATGHFVPMPVESL